MAGGYEPWPKFSKGIIYGLLKGVYIHIYIYMGYTEVSFRATMAHVASAKRP